MKTEASIIVIIMPKGKIPGQDVNDLLRELVYIALLTGGVQEFFVVTEMF